MNRLATEGIILRRLNYGEADRIITFLTSDFGKIRAMARGVRKQKSKMAGGIELFSVSELHLIKGKGDIDTLVSTRLKVNFGNIVKDLERTEAAYTALKIIERIIEDASGSDYFEVLEATLSSLDNPKTPVVLSEMSFAMRVLGEQGHVPDFRVDPNGKRLAAGARYQFDFEKMSFVELADGEFDQNHLKVLRLLTQNPPQVLMLVKGIKTYCEELAPMVRTIRQQYLGV